MEGVTYTLGLKVFSSLLYHQAENFIQQRSGGLVLQEDWIAMINQAFTGHLLYSRYFTVTFIIVLRPHHNPAASSLYRQGKTEALEITQCAQDCSCLTRIQIPCSQFHSPGSSHHTACLPGLSQPVATGYRRLGLNRCGVWGRFVWNLERVASDHVGIVTQPCGLCLQCLIMLCISLRDGQAFWQMNQ